jgi:hypothetical protein
MVDALFWKLWSTWDVGCLTMILTTLNHFAGSVVAPGQTSSRPKEYFVTRVPAKQNFRKFETLLHCCTLKSMNFRLIRSRIFLTTTRVVTDRFRRFQFQCNVWQSDKRNYASHQTCWDHGRCSHRYDFEDIFLWSTLSLRSLCAFGQCERIFNWSANLFFLNIPENICAHAW